MSGVRSVGGRRSLPLRRKPGVQPMPSSQSKAVGGQRLLTALSSEAALLEPWWPGTSPDAAQKLCCSSAAAAEARRADSALARCGLPACRVWLPSATPRPTCEQAALSCCDRWARLASTTAAARSSWPSRLRTSVGCAKTVRPASGRGWLSSGSRASTSSCWSRRWQVARRWLRSTRRSPAASSRRWRRAQSRIKRRAPVAESSRARRRCR